MFLDDQLYEKVIQTKINEPDDFKTLVNNLYRICEDYYKPKLSPGEDTEQEGLVEERDF